MEQFKTKEELKELNANIYNGSAFILHDGRQIVTPTEVLNNWNEYKGESLLYGIHWEGQSIYTEQGEEIKPTYV